MPDGKARRKESGVGKLSLGDDLGAVGMRHFRVMWHRVRFFTNYVTIRIISPTIFAKLLVIKWNCFEWCQHTRIEENKATDKALWNEVFSSFAFVEAIWNTAFMTCNFATMVRETMRTVTEYSRKRIKPDSCLVKAILLPPPLSPVL